MFVDIHAHLTDPHVANVDAIVNNAKKIGVKAIITNGLGPDDNQRQLDLAKRYDIVRPALGLYPHEAEKHTPQFDLIRNNAKHIAAIGEIGIDRKDSPSPKLWKKQLEGFSQMLELASELKKPVIIHSRKAEREVLDVLKNHDGFVVMHCFSGKMSLVKEGLDRGFFFSVPPILGNSSHFQALTKLADISRIMTETDTPYLGPVKGEWNEPANVTVTIADLAKIKGLEPEETAKVIFKNYMTVF